MRKSQCQSLLYLKLFLIPRDQSAIAFVSFPFFRLRAADRFLLIVNLRFCNSYLWRFPTHIAVIRYSELLFSARAVVLYLILGRSLTFDLLVSIDIR